MIHTAKTKALYHDCDVQGRLKISSAMRYMQQISGEHLEVLGFPAEKLLREHMVFMLSKSCIKVHRMPLASETLLLGTAPTAVKGARFVREFSIDSERGERLISAVTLWILIDTESRKILRPSTFPYDLPLEPLLTGDEIGNVAIAKPSECPHTHSESVNIRYSHIDINHHVSNSNYADFICDILPYDALLECGVDTLAINFQNEAKWGQQLTIQRDALADGAFYIRGKAHEDITCFESYVKLGQNRA